MFDITCTATLRPELLRATLRSHIENLFCDYAKVMRLIINVDVVGARSESKIEKASLVAKVEKVVRECDFGDVKMRVSYTPHFPTAFWWCIKQVRTSLFFNLEEDWQLLMPISFVAMVNAFHQVPELAHLRLSAFRSSDYSLKNWNKFLHWNGLFYEVQREERGLIGWAGHPSLNRTTFVKSCSKMVDKKANPEKQMKARRFPHKINPLMFSHRFGSFHPRNTQPAIKDIGREWMQKNKWQKAGTKAFFTNWQRIEEN